MATPYAFVTLVTSDSYLPGALTLAAALNDVHSDSPVAFETVCLVTPETVDVASIKLLRRAFNVVVGVELIVQPDDSGLKLLGRPDLDTVLTKLHIFRLTQYSKIIFLDADVLPVRPLSHLFTLPHEFSAVPDVGWPDIFNSGVLVLSPGEEKFTELEELLKSKGSWDGGDQGLLNEWRGDNWNRLSFTYNTTPTAAYTYAPAYERYGSQISAIHFIGPNKPWKSIAYRAPFSGPQPVDPNARAYDYNSLVDRWFSVYDEHYRSPNVIPDTRFEVKRYAAAWDETPAGGNPAMPPGDALGLEDLRLMAIQGMNASHGYAAPSDHRSSDGEYRSMPLEGRVDLIRPRLSLQEQIPDPSPAARTIPVDRLESSPPRMQTLPTPGPNEYPPSPHLPPRSLPPATPASRRYDDGPRYHYFQQSQGQQLPAELVDDHSLQLPDYQAPQDHHPPDHHQQRSWRSEDYAHGTSSAGGDTDSGGEYRALNTQHFHEQAQHSNTRPHGARRVSEYRLSPGHDREQPRFEFHASESDPSQHALHPRFAELPPQPLQEHTHREQHSHRQHQSSHHPGPHSHHARRSQASDANLGHRQQPGLQNHPGVQHGEQHDQQDLPHEHLEQSHHSQRPQAHRHPHHQPVQRAQETARPSSPPMLLWNPSVDPPPNDPPQPDAFPSDTYFPNAWDSPFNLAGDPFHGTPTDQGGFFQSPPPSDIPQALLMQGHYRQVTGESETGASPQPDSTKIKHVFPWEEKPRHMPARVFPEGEKPSPTQFIKPLEPEPSPPPKQDIAIPSTSSLPLFAQPPVRSPVFGLPTNLAFANAWDTVPSIQRYATKLVRPPPPPQPMPPPEHSRRRRDSTRSWDERATEQGSQDGDDEDEGDDEDNNEPVAGKWGDDSDPELSSRSSTSRMRSRSGSISASYIIKGKRKEYRVRGVQTVPKETRSQAVQVSISTDPPKVLTPSPKDRKPAARQASGFGKRQWNPASSNVLPPLSVHDASIGPDLLVNQLAASPTVFSPQGDTSGAVLSGVRSPREFHFPTSPPPGRITPRGAQTPPIALMQDKGKASSTHSPPSRSTVPTPTPTIRPTTPSPPRRNSVTAPVQSPAIPETPPSKPRKSVPSISRRPSSSSTTSTPSSAGPISPPDTQQVTLPPTTISSPSTSVPSTLRKSGRVWDPARGVELFKRNSEEVLARFLRMGSWEDEATARRSPDV